MQWFSPQRWSTTTRDARTSLSGSPKLMRLRLSSARGSQPDESASSDCLFPTECVGGLDKCNSQPYKTSSADKTQTHLYVGVDTPP